MKGSNNPYLQHRKQPTRHLDTLLLDEHLYDITIRKLVQQERDIIQLKSALNHSIDAILSLVDEESHEISPKMVDLVDQLRMFKTNKERAI